MNETAVCKLKVTLRQMPGQLGERHAQLGKDHRSSVSLGSLRCCEYLFKWLSQSKEQSEQKVKGLLCMRIRR
jgi:hypothetical protein